MTIFGNTNTDMHGEDEDDELIPDEFFSERFGKLWATKIKHTESSERVNSDAEEFEGNSPGEPMKDGQPFECLSDGDTNAIHPLETPTEDTDQPVKAVADEELLRISNALQEEVFTLEARIKDLEAKNALLMRENKEVVLDSERLEDKIEQMKHSHSMLEAELESQRDFAADMYCKEESTTLMQHLDAALEAGDLFKYEVMFSDGVMRSATRGIDPEELEQAMVSVRRALFGDEELN